jgi:hypothetical protein
MLTFVSLFLPGATNFTDVTDINNAGQIVGVAYGPFPPAVPLPTTLPLFATGLGFLALLGWRRKRNAGSLRC